MKSTTKDKRYCIKHSLFHGKKYKSCSPEESVEDILFGITGHKSTYQNHRPKIYEKLRKQIENREITFKNNSSIKFEGLPSKKVGEYKGLPIYSNPDVPNDTLILTDLPVERVTKKTCWTEGDIAITPIDCACNVHRTNDPEGKQISCLGHGLPCPCTKELLEKISVGEVKTDTTLESPEMPPEASK